jgi:lambda repressor-like predicted transcriptional regulator
VIIASDLPLVRQQLAEFLALPIEQQRSTLTVQRMRRQGWTLQSLSSLTGLSIDELTAKLREGTRC